MNPIPAKTFFERFHNTWLQHLHLLLSQLSAAPKPTSPEDHRYLSQLADRVMTHYEDYYRIKSHAAKHDVLAMFSAPWTTSLESSLHWIAGWRPTTVFHIVYTESSVRFEAQIVDLLRGHRTGDLGDLTPRQLTRVSELQCQTVREENEITEELSQWQNNSCDLVSPSANMEANIERLVEVLEKADDLRLKTLRRVVEILTPQQAVEFLIATAEVQLGIRGWGLEKDRKRESM
ncbi:PREDICTED: transcription factor TGA2 [Nelumbo nucifera]|uniref:Transcription factor TGA2 n=1 Tax=Nelumbo nucifera TaxID=4432 RepID=A0A1U8B7H3_NELNU|nr:PREDICTED: transcription factor TGA2 [Nelumbo nucifera]